MGLFTRPPQLPVQFLRRILPLGLTSPDVTVALTGVAATGAVGTLGPTTTVAITGNGAITAVGSVVQSASVPITGNTGTTAIASLTPSMSKALTGVSATGSVGSVAIPGQYDFACSSDGRYLTKNGDPFLVICDWAVTPISQLSLTEVADYADDRIAQGFNSVVVELITRQPLTAGPESWNGELPFTTNSSGGAYTGTSGTANFSTPNDDYFEYAQDVVEVFTSRGMLVQLMVMPFGFSGADANVDFYPDLNNSVNTESVCTTYGAYIANGHGAFTGFKNNPGILWIAGSDYGDNNATDPSDNAMARMRAIMIALRDNDALQLQTGDWQSPSMAADQSETEDLMQVNPAYTYGGGATYTDGSPTPAISGAHGLRTYELARRAYNYTPIASTQAQSGVTPDALPVWLEETVFEHSILSDYTGSPAELRRAHWWAYLSGCIAGINYGDEQIWQFQDGTWQGAVTDTSALDMGRMATFLNTVSWHLLVPSELDGMRRLITSANGTQTGTPSTYVSAACASNGSVLLAFFPNTGSSSQSATVDLRSMTSGSLRSRWWDPTNGNYTAIATGLDNSQSAYSVTITGANSVGANDWVLIVDTQSTDISLALTGVQATGSVGSLTNTHTLAITGNAGTTAVGSVTPSSAIQLTGNAGTGSVGSVSPRNTLALTGNSGTTTVGTVAPFSAIPITGNQATGTVGSVTAPNSSVLSGNTGTGSAGTVSPGITVALTGVQATGSVGSMSVGGAEEDEVTATFASDMLAQFDAMIAIVNANPRPHTLKPSRYRYTMDREPDSGIDGFYYLDLDEIPQNAPYFGTGETIWRGTVVVQLGFARGGGGKGGATASGTRRKVVDYASTDCMKVSQVCSNPDNYNSSASGIRWVRHESTRRTTDGKAFEVWEVRFSVEWRSDVITS